MDDIAAGVNCRKNRFTVDKNLHCRLFSTSIEAKGKFIKSWGDCHNGSLLFLPKEVFWASVHTLNVPRNSIAVNEISRFPEPSCYAVLSAEGFVDGSLLCKSLSELSDSDSSLKLFANFCESLINILNV